MILRSARKDTVPTLPWPLIIRVWSSAREGVEATEDEMGGEGTMPTATTFVPSGVTARSKILIEVSPQDLVWFP